MLTTLMPRFGRNRNEQAATCSAMNGMHLVQFGAVERFAGGGLNLPSPARVAECLSVLMAALLVGERHDIKNGTRTQARFAGASRALRMAACLRSSARRRASHGFS